MEVMRRLKRNAKKHGMILATYSPQVPLYPPIKESQKLHKNLKVEVLLTSGENKSMTFRTLRRSFPLFAIRKLNNSKSSSLKETQ